MGIEQRKHIRFIVKDNTFIALQNGHTSLGNIKNISKGGSLFEYLYKEKIIESEENYTLDIFMFGEEFRLTDIPCSIVYNTTESKSIENSYVPFFITRRCGITFGELSNKQVSQLSYFIENYTTGFVS